MEKQFIFKDINTIIANLSYQNGTRQSMDLNDLSTKIWMSTNSDFTECEYVKKLSIKHE